MKYILLFCALINVCYCAKLNVPKLLIPYHSAVPTNFTLRVNKGCFTWRSTRPEIASIQPVGNGPNQACSSEAVVTSTSRTPARRTAIIIAEDTVSGQQLRCDVIVDEIYNIEIETQTHELFLDDSPEEFLIRASNEEGDIFSSLDSQQFEWSLQLDTSSVTPLSSLPPAHTVLRFLQYEESSYSAAPHVKAIEQAGKRADRILVRGMRSGSAKVIARLEDSVYKTVKEASVRIIVMANIQLNPSVTYLLTHAQVTYKVELIKQTQIQEISMPSSQYYLSMDDTSIATMDTASSNATAIALGNTEVHLKDKHITIPGIFREPSAAIYVVNPGYLEFVVLPDRNWVLQSKNTYIIIIEIYDQESHRILPSDNVRVDADFPKEYFDVQYSTENGTYHIVHTLQRGFPVIEATLRAIVKPNGYEHVYDPAIQGAQDVEIYDPVSVLPQVVVLPWEPSLRTKLEYQLQASGGSGNYSWHSSQPEVATATQRGLASTSQRTGSAVITATDARHLGHHDSAHVHVLPPGGAYFLAGRVEAEIGTTLDLPLAVWADLDGEKVAFADCMSIPFRATVREQGIFAPMQATKPEVGGSCVNIRVQAVSLGHTVVTVNYKYLDVSLSASVTIAAYKPLKPVDPEELSLVTPGASRELLFEGGPQPWVLAPENFYEKASAENANLVSLSPVRGYESQKLHHVFRAVCKSLGEQTVSLTVGNRASAENKFPALAKATVRFACADPAGIRLTPLVPRPTGLPPCPISPEFDDPVPAYNFRNLDMLVTVADKDGRRFDNFSSVDLTWQLSDSSLAAFQLEDKLTMETVLLDSGSRRIQSTRTLSMKQRVGLLTVTASISGYNSRYIKGHRLQLDAPISNSRGLDLVEPATINPSFLTIYNHQSTKPGLKIEKGSGHFIVDDVTAGGSGTAAAAQFRYDARARTVHVEPVAEGRLQVVVRDLCLDPSPPARATVFISDVHQIQLTVVDKVEIQNEIVAQVQVLDSSGQAIPVKYYPTMNVQPTLASDIISIRPESTNGEETTATYRITGLVLGRTKLQFSANQKKGKQVNSPPREIQVFPPLRLADRNITLIKGAIFQVTANGGPQPQSSLEYSITNDTVGDVTQSGLFTAEELGVTWLIGRAVGNTDGESTVVYSQDKITITVIPLEGIRIFAPLQRLQTATHMPLYAVGINDNETPFTFGSAVPPLRFYWSISNTETARLVPLFEKSGIIPTPENNFATRLFAEEPGHVTVTLKVSVDATSRQQMIKNAKVVDSVQIQVFERLQLVKPSVCDGTILITPDTHTRVKTNRDGSSARLSYAIIAPTAAHDGLPPPPPVASVDEYGNLVSGARTGDASLLVTAHEDFGTNQTLVIHIKVKQVAYIAVAVTGALKTVSGRALEAVPVGSLLSLAVTFHDSVGELFYATNSKVAFRPNRFDLLQITHGSDNDTLIAKATNVGSTVLKVWDTVSSRPLVDYVNIDVGFAIQPAEQQILLGDVVCFNSPLLTEHDQPGMWSSPNAVLDFDQEGGSGVAIATHAGSATVYYNVSASTTTYTQVTVGHIYNVRLENKDIDFLTNVASKYNKNNIVAVSLEDLAGTPRKTVHDANCSSVLLEREFRVYRPPVRCDVALARRQPQLQAQDLITATAAFDTNIGQYVCQLSPAASTVPADELSALVAGMDLAITVRAVVTEREGGQQQVASSLLTLPYVPAFYVHAAEVHVSDAIPTATLRITAAPRVRDTLKVSSSDPGLVKVLPPTQQDNSLSYSVELQLSKSLWDRYQLDAIIEVSSSLTGQEKKIPVRVKLVAPKGDTIQSLPMTWSDLALTLANNYTNILLTLVLIIATIICIVIGYYAIQGQRYNAAAAAAVAANTSAFLSPPPGYAAGEGKSFSKDKSFSTSSPGQWSPGGAKSPRLWSVDYGPYDTSSLYKRSPSHYSPSPTGH